MIAKDLLNNYRWYRSKKHMFEITARDRGYLSIKSQLFDEVGNEAFKLLDPDTGGIVRNTIAHMYGIRDLSYKERLELIANGKMPKLDKRLALQHLSVSIEYVRAAGRTEKNHLVRKELLGTTLHQLIEIVNDITG